jgi:hypothetical protein
MSLQLKNIDKEENKLAYKQILERTKELATKTKKETLAELMLCYRSLKRITETCSECCDERAENHDSEMSELVDKIDSLRLEIEFYIHNLQIFLEFTEGETND